MSVLLVAVCISVLSDSAFSRRKRPPRRPSNLEKFDANKDGKLSLDEWLEHSKWRFKEMDRNKDGYIDKDEMGPQRRRDTKVKGMSGKDDM